MNEPKQLPVEDHLAHDTLDDDALIDRLAKLPELEYERERDTAKESLGISRASVLDRLVKQRRQDLSIGGERNELIDGVEAWPDPVDGLQLAEEMLQAFHRYTILPDGADTALVLWAFGTYCYDAFRIFPKLCLSSPEKRCGKTTTLETLSAFTHRTILASNITPSVIFRAVELWHPTLMIDEGDTFVDGNEELRGIINSGHTRSTAHVWRTEGDGANRQPTQFSTWAPMVIAMIKTPPDTIKDRSVMIKLRRKMPGEEVSKLPADIFALYPEHRQKLQRWAADNLEQLRIAKPVEPNTGNDRADDNWMPLLAIADCLGGNWLADAMVSLKEFNTDFSDDDSGIGPMILSDIRGVLNEKRLSEITSDELASALGDMEDRPWCEWRNGAPITKAALAVQLKPYGVGPGKIGSSPRGYRRSWFEDAFNRYLAPEPSADVYQAGQSGRVEMFSNDAASSVPPSHAGVEQGGNWNDSDLNGCEDQPKSTDQEMPLNDRDKVPLSGEFPLCSTLEKQSGTLQPSNRAGCSTLPLSSGETGGSMLGIAEGAV